MASHLFHRHETGTGSTHTYEDTCQTAIYQFLDLVVGDWPTKGIIAAAYMLRGYL